MKNYTIGVDFGTLSARALLLDTYSGKEILSVTIDYPHAVMDKQLPSGVKLPRGSALQHPGDYIFALSNSLKQLLQESGVSKNEIKGFGFDFTGSTVLPLKSDGTPLCFDSEFSNEPHSYVKLWKHNTAVKEAEIMTRVAIKRKEKWLKHLGGKISAEWLFPKVLETKNNAPEVYEKADCFVEAADYITRTITGSNICSGSFAGFKSLWSKADGFPSNDYFKAIDPEFENVIETKIPKVFEEIAYKGLTLNAKGAQITGLNEGTPVSLPQLDAHASLPGMGITDSGKLLLILGTSAVHLILSEQEIKIDGICGYHLNSVVPNKITYESGQICCGDIFEWFTKNCVPASYTEQAEEQGISIHKYLREKANKQRPGEHGLIALDWFNGNRSILSDSELTGMILGLTLQTAPEDIYRALIEATAFGTRVILENYEKGGIPITDIIASGGIAVKDPMTMQIYTDIIGKPIYVGNSIQSSALGSAIYASYVARIFPDISTASKKCSAVADKLYTPIPENAEIYNKIYKEYLYLHDLFGKQNGIMKRIKNSVQ